MKDIGYGKGYAYDHDAEEGFSGANYWPEEMEPQTYLRTGRARLRARGEEADRLLEQAARRARRG